MQTYDEKEAQRLEEIVNNQIFDKKHFWIKFDGKDICAKCGAPANSESLEETCE